MHIYIIITGDIISICLKFCFPNCTFYFLMYYLNEFCLFDGVNSFHENVSIFEIKIILRL